MFWKRASATTADLASAADSLRFKWDERIADTLRAAGAPGLEALIDAYRSSRGRDESEALDFALARMGRMAVPRLISLLDDPELSAVATWGLGAIGDRRAVPALMQSARSAPHPEVRWSAVNALGKLRDGRAFDTLVAVLDDEHARLAAILALAALGDRRAIEPLRRVADGPSGTAVAARRVIQDLEIGR